MQGRGRELFFGPDAEFVTARKKREAEAKAICAGCPARDACLAYALDAGEAYGVWGGLTEDERRAMLRQPEGLVSRTEIGYPPVDKGPLQVLRSHMPEPEPLPEPEPEPEAEI